jgi:hypothetical protein
MNARLFYFLKDLEIIFSFGQHYAVGQVHLIAKCTEVKQISLCTGIGPLHVVSQPLHHFCFPLASVLKPYSHRPHNKTW